MNAIREQMRREHPADYDTGTIAVVPLGDALTSNVRAALFVLLAAVTFVLLIACANVANLLLARSVTRQRELALRAVLGAGRARIARQLLTESFMLSAGGAIAGALLAMVAVEGLATLAPVSLPRIDRIAVDGRVLAFTAAMAILTSLVFGLVPALRGSAAGAPRTLAVDSRASVGGRSRARSVLVVADLVLALVLLAGAGLMLRTVSALMHASPGFNPERILALQFSLVGKAYAEDPAVVVFQDRTLEKLRAIPGVEAAALAGQIPFGGNGDCWGFHANGRMKTNPVDDPVHRALRHYPRLHQPDGHSPARRAHVHERGYGDGPARGRDLRIDGADSLGKRQPASALKCASGTSRPARGERWWVSWPTCTTRTSRRRRPPQCIRRRRRSPTRTSSRS